jgi:type IV pilus assembly protein PilQ
MKSAIPAIVLTMFLAGGCAQKRMTQFDYRDVHLEVGGRVTQSPGLAQTDFKPGIYYSVDTVNKQVLIEARILEIGRRDMQILGIDWFSGSGALISASDIVNTTPKDEPMAMGGLVNIGIGGGSRGGSRRGGCPHGPGCRSCGSSGGGGLGGGINFPVIAGGGSDGKQNNNITSLRTTFDLSSLIDLEDSYVAITIQLGREANGRIISQPFLLPIKVQPKVDPPPAPPVRKAATTVMIRDDQTIVLGGLITEDEAGVKDRIPILGDIPLLGRLFKNRAEKTAKRNLIIFVTPRIIIQSEE